MNAEQGMLRKSVEAPTKSIADQLKGKWPDIVNLNQLSDIELRSEVEKLERIPLMEISMKDIVGEGNFTAYNDLVNEYNTYLPVLKKESADNKRIQYITSALESFRNSLLKIIDEFA